MYDFDQMNAAAKDMMDTQLAAAAAVSRQMQTIASESAEFAKKSAEMNASYFEKLMNQKSMEGAMQVQSDYAKTVYETYVSEAKKFGELYQGLAKEMTKPAEEAASKAKAAAPKTVPAKVAA